MNTGKIIAFDADDTLWDNEDFFRKAEKQFCSIASDILPYNKAMEELFAIEMQNMEDYGYGIKAFVLSMIECLIKISDSNLTPDKIQKLLDIGKDMINKPVELLDGVENCLESLSSSYQLVLATKGDALDQERKLKKSGLEKYFPNVFVMSNKAEENYARIFNQLNIKAKDFIMIGNSLKSDILPVLNLGGYAIYKKSKTTWKHEDLDEKITSDRFFEINDYSEIPTIIEKI
ncbi:MAG: HAD family hydrolase [Marinifilaceae bacterium]|jgi:putative hydrolase of the HAD superfamily|nr:HAD family hydrolase [Marinifilaceae bacterium]